MDDNRNNDRDKHFELLRPARSVKTRTLGTLEKGRWGWDLRILGWDGFRGGGTLVRNGLKWERLKLEILVKMDRRMKR